MAMTGFLYNSVCHDSLSAATIALYNSPAYMNLSNGSTAYFTTPQFSGGNLYIQGWQLINGSYSYRYTTSLPTPSFPSCDPTLSDFAFNPVLFEMVYQKGLLFFSVGLGIGLIISLIRKLRTR